MLAKSSPKSHKVDACCFPECSEPIACRGLCHNHYIVAYRLVKKGEATWESLEKAGKCIGTVYNKTAAKDWFLEG